MRGLVYGISTMGAATGVGGEEGVGTGDAGVLPLAEDVALPLTTTVGGALLLAERVGGPLLVALPVGTLEAVPLDVDAPVPLRDWDAEVDGVADPLSVLLPVSECVGGMEGVPLGVGVPLEEAGGVPLALDVDAAVPVPLLVPLAVGVGVAVPLIDSVGEAVPDAVAPTDSVPVSLSVPEGVADAVAAAEELGVCEDEGVGVRVGGTLGVREPLPVAERERELLAVGGTLLAAGVRVPVPLTESVGTAVILRDGETLPLMLELVEDAGVEAVVEELGGARLGDTAAVLAPLLLLVLLPVVLGLYIYIPLVEGRGLGTTLAVPIPLPDSTDDGEGVAEGLLVALRLGLWGPVREGVGLLVATDEDKDDAVPALLVATDADAAALTLPVAEQDGVEAEEAEDDAVADDGDARAAPLILGVELLVLLVAGVELLVLLVAGVEEEEAAVPTGLAREDGVSGVDVDAAAVALTLNTLVDEAVATLLSALLLVAVPETAAEAPAGGDTLGEAVLADVPEDEAAAVPLGERVGAAEGVPEPVLTAVEAGDIVGVRVPVVAAELLRSVLPLTLLVAALLPLRVPEPLPTTLTLTLTLTLLVLAGLRVPVALDVAAVDAVGV